MVRGEEKQFELTIENIIDYTRLIKDSLAMLIHRIETEGQNMNWPQVLDSFTNICDSVNTLMRFTRENKAQFIENRVVLPYLISRDRDEELVKLTEGRVQVVDHEMVPDYLRTKPDLEIEEFERSLVIKANTITPDQAVKQINAMNKLIDNNINLIRANNSRIDTEIARQVNKPSYVTSETHELLKAISEGKNIASGVPTHRANMMGMGPNDQLLGQKPPESLSGPVIMNKQNVKAPELKTNIKTT